MNKSFDLNTITNDDLKSYATYLLGKYIKINEKYEDSSYYCELKQFVNEGVIKDLISKNSSLPSKIKYIDCYRIDLIKFAIDFDCRMEVKPIQSFKDKFVYDRNIF